MTSPSIAWEKSLRSIPYMDPTKLDTAEHRACRPEVATYSCRQAEEAKTPGQCATSRYSQHGSEEGSEHPGRRVSHSVFIPKVGICQLRQFCMPPWVGTLGRPNQQVGRQAGWGAAECRGTQLEARDRNQDHQHPTHPSRRGHQWGGSSN